MATWIGQRATEMLIALLIIALAAWCIVKQPFAMPKQAQALLPLESQLLESNLQTLLKIRQEATPVESTIGKVAGFLGNQLSDIGKFESTMSSPGLYRLSLKFGKLNKKNHRALVVHHVVAEKPSGRGVKALVALVALAKQMQTLSSMPYSAEVVIFLHSSERLVLTLKEAAKQHAESLKARNIEAKVIVWAPSILLPDVFEQSSRWKFLAFALPDENSQIALYSRVMDFAWLRQLKANFKAAKSDDVQSLSVLYTFPKVPRFPLNAYWEQKVPAVLLRTDYVGAQSDYAGITKLVTGLQGALITP